jgi:DNA repair exonuclease SbcCD ATPase subunit
MIQRLQLQNWRAYDRLDLELGPGATFLVASNGIGKTSLIMAAAWGIFGDIAGVSGADEIRGEAEQATVTVELRLPSGATLVITRSVDQRGRATVEGSIGDRVLTSQKEIDAVLSAEFGADARILAQLTVMIHGGLHESQGEFILQDHLAGVFGVRPLFEAAARAEALAAETASALRKTKVVERKDQRETEELLADLGAAERDLLTAGGNRERAVAALNDASERLRGALEWATYRTAVAERAAKLGAYAEVAGSLLGRDLEPDGVLVAMTEWEAEVERSVSEAATEAATARGRAGFIRDAIANLDNKEAVCPTCLRPLDQHEAEQAVHQHARHLDSLSETIADAEERAGQQRDVLANLRRILADVRSVPIPVEPSSPDEPGDLDAVRRAHDAARDEVQRLDQDIAMRTAALTTIQEALDAIQRDQERTDRLGELFRLEGLAQAATQTLRGTADRIMGHQIEPLVAEIARRWKQTFGKEGLQLSPDGRITRTVGGRTLGFGALSGGERVWALLVTRLLVAGASTQAPFVWLDEPLEHLDPRLRRIVAGTLAMASSHVGLRQVIVTTYEAPIAQQLMEDVPSASLIYVTSSE